MSRAAAFWSMVAGALGLWASAALPLPILLVWNASASAPVGLYGVDPDIDPRVGDRVAVVSPEPVAAFLAARGYLPREVLLLKTLAAEAPARVCRRGLRVSIDGRFVALARARDRHDRPLPTWSGCRDLAPDEVFLLTSDVPDSLDGRYFGATPRAAIRGVARPVRLGRRAS